jgi:hypothetical protein
MTEIGAKPLTALSLSHRVVCLVGSTRFLEHISAAAAAETTAGRIVVRPEVRVDPTQLLGLDRITPLARRTGAPA